MMQNFVCPACGRLISAAVPAGAQVRCPLCNQAVTVPPGAVGVSPMGGPPPLPGPAGYIGERPKRQGMAIASLVCGVASVMGLALCVPLPLIGAALGIVAMRRTSRQPDEYGGRGLAIGGLVTSAVGILILAPVTLALLIPSFALVRAGVETSMCQANLHVIGAALRSYGAEYQDFPETENGWELRLMQFGAFTQTYYCPSAQYPSPHYRYVPGLSPNSPSSSVIVFDRPGNHPDGGGNVLRVDGTVEFLEDPAFSTMVEAVAPPSEEDEASEDFDEGDY